MNARVALIIAAVVTLVLPSVPIVGALLRPFVWLQTFCHELGHGVAALVCGAQSIAISVYVDASGLTHNGATSHAWSAGEQGFVAMAGLVGPACASALFFVSARGAKRARVLLAVFALLLLACAAVVVDNAFGQVVVGAWGLAIALAAWRAPPQIACAFVGIDLGLSVFSRGDYLFAKTAHTGGGTFPSDVENVASSWGGVALFWGLAIGAFSVALVLLGLFIALRGSSQTARR
ncbi:MAG TPA: M50 family metallopeptidase [Myxococcota bacterium]